jgi:hypothetical protein
MNSQLINRFRESVTRVLSVLPWAVWLFILLLLLLDFFSRVLVTDDHQMRRFVKPVIPSSSLRSLQQSSVAESKVATWMPLASPETEAKKAERAILLEGVFIHRNARVAMLGLVAEGSPVERLRVVPGDTVDGWKVDSISTRRVALSRDGENRELVILRGRTDVGTP